MAVKTPILDAPQGIIADSSYETTARANTEFNDLGAKVSETAANIDQSIGEHKGEELQKQMQQQDDILTNAILEEDKAAAAIEQQYIDTWKTENPGSSADKAAADFARKIARIQAAKDQKSITEAEVVLMQSKLLKDAIRQNPRYANVFRQVASTVGGFGMLSPELTYLLDQRKAEAQAESNNDMDWLIKMAVENKWASPEYLYTNPVKFYKDMIDGWTAAQSYQQNIYKLKGFEVGSQEAEQTLNTMTADGMKTWTATFFGRSLNALAQQHNWTDIQTLNDAIKKGTYPDDVNKLATELRAAYSAFVADQYSKLGDAKKYITMAQMQTQMKPLESIMEESIKHLGTDEFGKFIENAINISKAGYMTAIGLDNYWSLDILGKLDSSLLGQAVGREFQASVVPKILTLLGNNNIYDANGTIDMSKIKLSDLGTQMELNGVPQEQINKTWLEIVNSLGTYDVKKDPQWKAKYNGTEALVLLNGFRYYGNQFANGNVKGVQPKVVTDAFLRLLSKPEIVSDFANQSPEFRADFSRSWRNFVTAETQVLINEVSKDMGKEANNPVYPEGGYNAGAALNSGGLVSPPPAVIVGNPETTAVIELTHDGNGNVRFQQRKDIDPNIVSPFVLSKAKDQISVLNMKYSRYLSDVVKSQAHASAIAANDTQVYYDSSFEALKSIMGQGF